MMVQNIKQKILPILRKGGITKAAIFGSFARGEEKKRSDIDILINFNDEKSLLDIIHLQFELEGTLGRKVDLLTYDGLSPLLKDQILKEQKVIYEEEP